MGRRILAFFLGMIFGIALLVGGIAGVLYYAATSVTPGDVYPDSNKFLGDFASMSLMDIFREISDLYRNKIGKIGDNGLYYTLGEFLEAYNIDTKEAFGVELDADVLEIPIFELMGGDMDAALKQIKMSALFQIVNLASATTNEEGGETGGFFSEAAITKMRDYSVADLLSEDKGAPYVFEPLLLCDVFGDLFPAEVDDGAIMWAFGQTSLGRLISGFNGNILLQFRADGAFEAMGNLKMTQLFGDSSQLVTAIFGNSTFGELIDENGNINPDGLMDTVYIGNLVGLNRNEIDNANDYETLFSTGKKAVKQKQVGDEYFYVIEIEDIAYEAKLACNKDDEQHTHDASCYGFVWYKANAETYDESNYATGIYNAIADVTIADLMSGDSDALMDRFMDIQLHELLEGQETSGLLDSIGDMTLRELVNEGVDNVYLGTVLANERKPIDDIEGYEPFVAVSEDNPELSETVLKNSDGAYVVKERNVWYEGKITCGIPEHQHTDLCRGNENVCGLEAHKHDATCFRFVWYTDAHLTTERTGTQGYLCNFQLGEINNINTMVQSMTLLDVMSREENIPPMLRSLKNVSIRNIGNAINDMFLGEFLGYERKVVESVDTDALTPIFEPKADGTPSATFAYYLYKQGNTIALSANGMDFYKGVTLCDDEGHAHTSNCYAFVWYDCNSSEENHTHDATCEVTGVMSKLAGEKISNLSNLMDTVKTFTLKDVLGNDVPDILKSIENTPIGELSSAIESMYLGNFLGYQRNVATDAGYTAVDGVTGVKQKVVGEAENSYTLYIIEDEGVWYEAKLACESKHTHNDRSCFDYLWYDCAGDSETHTHGNGCSEAEGLTSKLASVKVSELNTINDRIMDFTLYDVMDGKVPSALKSIQYTKIRELSGAIDSMYLGDFLNYKRIEVAVGDYTAVDGLDSVKQKVVNEVENSYTLYAIEDDGVWYEGKIVCNHAAGDTHDRSCFDFVWYGCADDSDGHVHGDSCVVKDIMGKMASMKINELNADSIKKIIDNTTLNEVINMDGASNLLKELGNTKIGELSNELNALYVGIALGYHREEVTGFTPTTEPIKEYREGEASSKLNAIYDEDDGVYFYDATHNKYYTAQLTCTLTMESHEHIFKCYGFYWYNCEIGEDGEFVHVHDDSNTVKGLNGKMSNLRIDELSGDKLTEIASSLTMGDLIDGGMMTPTEEDEYKLDLMFDDCGKPGCDYASYTIATKTPGPTYGITAADYYKSIHDDESERGKWKAMMLTNFIESMLGAL